MNLENTSQANQEKWSKLHDIYSRYKNTMYSVAYDISKNFYDAEDIVETSLMKLMDILDKIDPREIPTSRCKNLVITITKNTAIDLLRKTARESMTGEIIESRHSSKSAEDLHIEHENIRNILKGIEALDEIYRDVLRLKGLLRMSSKEAAQILNVNEFCVNTRYMRAKRLLAKELEKM